MAALPDLLLPRLRGGARCNDRAQVSSQLGCQHNAVDGRTGRSGTVAGAGIALGAVAWRGLRHMRVSSCLQ
jgi:hypothetical protein